MTWIYPLYYRIYRLDLGTVFLLMGIGVLGWAFLSYWIGRRYQISWKIANFILLLCFLFLILYYTVLRREQHFSRQIVFRPFAALEAAKNQSEIYRELTMNVLLFFPCGLLFSQLLPTKWSTFAKMLLTVLFGLLCSIGIESMQYVLVCGDVETDDVICNTVGSLIGAFQLSAAALLRHLLPLKHRGK